MDTGGVGSLHGFQVNRFNHFHMARAIDRQLRLVALYSSGWSEPACPTNTYAVTRQRSQSVLTCLPTYLPPFCVSGQVDMQSTYTRAG